MGYGRTNFSAATAAVANRFITATTMKRGTYGAPANSGAMPTAGAAVSAPWRAISWCGP